MKRAFFYFLTASTISLSGCNFSPGALAGDVNDDPWDWNASSSYQYNSSRYSFACMYREIESSNTDRGCTVPGNLADRLAKVTGTDDRLEIEFRKENADDNFQITSLTAMRDSFSSNSRFTSVSATCTEDKAEGRTFSQRYVCTVPSNRLSTDRFNSMIIVNQKCGSYTVYSLPSSCSTQDSYTAKYGSEYFPTF